MKKTRKNYEICLNQELSKLNGAEVFEKYSYLTKGAGLVRCVRNNTLGTLIRKKDPVLFNVGYTEWCNYIVNTL